MQASQQTRYGVLKVMLALTSTSPLLLASSALASEKWGRHFSYLDSWWEEEVPCPKGTVLKANRGHQSEIRYASCRDLDGLLHGRFYEALHGQKTVGAFYGNKQHGRWSATGSYNKKKKTVVRYEGVFEKGVAAGVFRRWEAGKLVHEADLSTGKKTFALPFAGLGFVESSFRNGLKHGPETQYWKGKKSFESAFEDGEAHGLSVWYKDGVKTKETNFVRGVEHGVATQFSTDGSIVGTYTMDYGTGTQLEKESAMVHTLRGIKMVKRQCEGTTKKDASTAP